MKTNNDKKVLIRMKAEACRSLLIKWILIYLSPSLSFSSLRLIDFFNLLNEFYFECSRGEREGEKGRSHDKSRWKEENKKLQFVFTFICLIGCNLLLLSSSYFISRMLIYDDFMDEHKGKLLPNFWRVCLYVHACMRRKDFFIKDNEITLKAKIGGWKRRRRRKMPSFT